MDTRRDELITCECGVTFVWSAEEQVFYAAKGLHRPKRCKPCRQAKRQASEQRALTASVQRRLWPEG